MFEYLRDSAAGNALFMLYKALKHQMEKGPIDAVTAEARNTLSEDRLLRENVEATVLVRVLSEHFGMFFHESHFLVIKCFCMSQSYKLITGSSLYSICFCFFMIKWRLSWFQSLTVFEENKSITCKMLSSDSISQAKEKALDALYKNIPYSKRPSLYDVNLGELKYYRL